MFMRTIALISLAGCQAHTGASETSPDFAIKCLGTAEFAGDPTKDSPVRTYNLPPQIYVFNEVARKVKIALIPRQEFEDVCFKDGYIDSRDFSPGLLSVTSEKQGARCELRVDRQAGKGSYFSAQDLPNGSTATIEFDMTCKPTEVPSFDKSKNLF